MTSDQAEAWFVTKHNVINSISYPTVPYTNHYDCVYGLLVEVSLSAITSFVLILFLRANNLGRRSCGSLLALGPPEPTCSALFTPWDT